MLKALASGLAGAVALTILHETARQFLEDAPRVDITGERAAEKALSAVGVEVITKKTLYPLALVGDLVSNSAFYSLVGVGGRENVLVTGATLGLIAGVGTVVLPEQIGLGSRPTARTPQTVVMTVAWYTIGGLTAGAVCNWLSQNFDEQQN